MKMGNSGNQPNNDDDSQCDGRSRNAEAICGGNQVKLLAVSIVCLVGFVVFSVLNDSSSKKMWTVLDHLKHFEKDPGENHTRPVDLKQDKFLGGLLPEWLDEKSCLSRYQSFQYRKGQQMHRPSFHLISRLRNYEALHKRCGPGTKSFKRSMEYLKSGNYSIATDCKYVVWMPRDGLGNRMITLVSAFLYALLTQKVLLVHRGGYISDLFCEPFPEASWLIPPDFPIIDQFESFNIPANKSYGDILRNKVLDGSNGSLNQPYLYLYLSHDYDDDDRRFFCDEDQIVIQEVPWQIINANLYFVPSLFLIPSFQEELNKLFPEKDTVFHFLGQYLFHPTNPVWGAISRYYNAYLATAHEKVGIQIRIFDPEPDPFEHYMDQILACVFKEDILPRTNETEYFTNPSGNSNKTKAVLVTSLSSKYYEAIRNMYVEHPTVTGEIIQVHQPSNEVHQHTEERAHNMKALAEIYLLGFTEKVVTSSWSTFGYVAYSLGGLKPWILYKPHEYSPPNAACEHALSMEPCFLLAPMTDCNTGNDSAKIVPHVRHCEDNGWTTGLKLVDKLR